MKIICAIGVLITCCVLAGAQTGQPAHQHGKMATGDGSFNQFVVADRRGGFYVAYVERANGAANVMLQRLAADGRPSSNAVRVNDRAGDAAVRNENPPKIATGPGDDVYVCWAN